MRVWTGNSDADESSVHIAICENQVLGRVIRERRLSKDGCCALQAKLTFFDNAQIISKHDIEVIFIEIEQGSTVGKEHEAIHKVFEFYTQAMIAMKSSHDEQLAKFSDGFSKMSEAFARGMGEISQQNKQISKFARKLERDRRNLNEALIQAISQAKRPTEPQDTNMIDTAIRGIGLLKSFGGTNDSGNSSGNGGAGSSGSGPGNANG